MEPTIQKQINLVRMRVQLPRVFTPGAPVSKRDSFLGRTKEISLVLDAVARPGTHAVIFGERGVGKTSLAGLIHDLWTDFSKDMGIFAPRVNCEPLDDYASIWAHVADAIMLDAQEKQRKLPGRFDSYLFDLYNGAATPNLVRLCFEAAGDLSIIIVDEFDRMDDETVGRFADTIKTLSDHSVEATLVLVGVAETIDELIADHASIDRGLKQIFLPRLTPDDIRVIVRTGYKQIGMSINEAALTFIARLAQGLPYYAHLIGLTAGIAAIEENRKRVIMRHISKGLESALENASESIRSSYYQATVSTRKDSLYKQVLLACALAESDEYGYFTASDVREPLSKIMKEHYDIPKYLRHLAEFTTDNRSNVLERSGIQWKQHYRFRDPLLKPYLIFQGIEEGYLEPKDLA